MPSVPDLTLINSACVMIGAEPIQSIDAEIPASQAARSVYVGLIDDLLSFYPWSFTKQTQQLQQLDGKPDDGFAYRYLVPPDANGRPIQISDQNNFSYDFTKYSYVGQELHADATQIWAIIKVSPLPVFWSPSFRFAATVALAGYLALAMTQDKDLKDRLLKEAFGPPDMLRRGGLMAIAIQEDTVNQPSTILASDGGPLVAARRSGPGYWW